MTIKTITMTREEFVASVRASYLARERTVEELPGGVQGGKLGLRATDGRSFIAAGPWAGSADEARSAAMIDADAEMVAEHDARCEAVVEALAPLLDSLVE